MSLRFMMTLIVAACLVTRSEAGESVGRESEVSETTVRSVVEKSLPYIEKQGLYWIEKKKCVSCHRISFMTWSLSAAARRGFEVDLAKLNEWIDWSVGEGIPKAEGDKPVATKNADGLSQQLFSRHEYPENDSRNESWARYVDLIVDVQRKDGSWKPAGQLPGQKRPQKETADISAGWHTLALSRELDAQRDSARQESIRSALMGARRQFGDRQQATSTEWYVLKLLLATQQRDDDAVAGARAELLTLQKPDGSWGWLTADPGDALATGMSLYALAASSESNPDHADGIQKAIGFLQRTQRDDGSWAVKGTKEKKKDSVEETAVYWGTTWAVIGLLETLPVRD